MKPLFFTSLTLLLSATSPFVYSMSPTNTNIINDLKRHYASVKKLDKLNVTYTKQRETIFQSNRLDQPFTINSEYDYKFDLGKKQFYLHQVHHYPGNYIFNDKIVHQHGKTVLYDVNGFTKGKQLEYLDYDTSDFQEDLYSELDIFSANQFLSMATPSNTTISQSQQQVAITFKKSKQDGITYTFTRDPVALTTIVNTTKNEKTEFTNPKIHNGLSVASTIRHYKKGVLKSTVNITDINRIMGIKDQTLAIPQGYGPFVDGTKKPLEWVTLASNLYLINHVAGNRHVMVKQDMKGLTVFGIPRSNDTSIQVHNLIKKHLPNKKIHSVYVTHGHSDHMGGAAYYGNLGATIIADKHSIKALKTFPRFKKDAHKWAYKALNHGQQINGVTFYAPKNSHSEGQSFAYFPQSKIIYQGDFLEIPADNSLPSHMADVEREFIEFLYQENIPYQRIVGHHRNNNMSPKVVNAYYNLHHKNG